MDTNNQVETVTSDSESKLIVYVLPVDEEALITTSNLADYLGVKENTISGWRVKGGIGPQYIKVGRGVRYRVGSVKEWQEEETIRP